VTVKAAEPEDAGAYRLHVVNVPISRDVPHDPDAALEAFFGRLDDNDDGVLSKEEARPALPPAVLPIVDRIFNNWDENGDGELDFAEFDAGVEQLHRGAPVGEPVREFFGRFRRR
jgi:Ca2+-binding EF-hand superfamily protein